VIDFKNWYSKVGYKFLDNPKMEFQIYLYYLLHMPITDNKSVILDYLNLINPRNCEIPKDDVIRLFNQAYREYEGCINLIKDNTLKSLKSVNKLKEELKSCDGDRASELRYYLTVLAGALKTLNEEQQRIIACRYFEGMSYANIGKSMGRSTSYVKSRIDGAIESIQEILFDIYDIHEWNI
jgi:RNA polymerase sigma factor (sigma-70 family)